MAENLFCPRCGHKFAPETQYCRKCGLALEAVSKIVTGDAENAPVATKRPNYAGFRLGLGLFIVGLVIGLANGAIRDLQIYPEVYGKIVFTYLSLQGFCVLVFDGVSVKERRKANGKVVWSGRAGSPRYVTIVE